MTSGRADDNDNQQTTAIVPSGHNPSPRPLPTEAALQFGQESMTNPGFYEFVCEAADEGFAISHPSDHDLTEDEWEDIAVLRVRTLVSAYRRSQR